MTHALTRDRQQGLVWILPLSLCSIDAKLFRYQHFFRHASLPSGTEGLRHVPTPMLPYQDADLNGVVSILSHLGGVRVCVRGPHTLLKFARAEIFSKQSSIASSSAVFEFSFFSLLLCSLFPGQHGNRHDHQRTSHVHPDFLLSLQRLAGWFWRRGKHRSCAHCDLEWQSEVTASTGSLPAEGPCMRHAGCWDPPRKRVFVPPTFAILASLYGFALELCIARTRTAIRLFKY